MGSIKVSWPYASITLSVAVLKNHDMERVCIYASDISKITGRNIRYSQNLLKDLKFMLNKKKHQYITKKELANYLSIDPDSFRLK